MFMGIIIFVLLVWFFRYISLGSIVVSMFLPFIMFWSHCHYAYVILSAVLSVIIVFKHKSNIKRLIIGRERKVFEKK
ncbi:MAG: glycerol-3-phosphate acyltransferase [Candidatus Omnitrophota bacterium]